MNRKAALAGLAVLGAGALALTACAPAGTSPAPSGSASTAPEELALVGYEEVPGSEVQQGGTLNLAIDSSPTDEGSWNPNHQLAQNVPVQDMLEPTLSNLIKVNADGSWEANTNYATSVELTSEDPQVVTVKLNDKAVFEDGTSVTADDYIATYKANAGAADGYEVVPSGVWDFVGGYEAVSATEFTVTFSETFADWPSLFGTPVMPAAIANDKDAFNTGYTDKPIPSVGPYVIEKIDNAAKIYTMKPNPLWWGDEKPKLDAINWKVVAQETAPQAYANDEIDAIRIATPDALQTAESKDGATVQRSGGVTWAHLTFNGTKAPFDDVNVRQAVAMAVDRELIARVANEPLGAPATIMGDWTFMPGQDGYKDIFGEVIGNDLDKAKALLEESGWTNADGKWTKDGETLTFAVTVPAGTQSNINRALGVQDSLKALDIEVTLNEVPSENYFTNIDAKDFQAVTFGWQGTLFPISSSETLYTPADSPQNYPGVTDDRLADLYKQANTELDPAKRIEIANQIDTVIAEYMPSVPIYPYPEVEAVDSGIVNYGPATFKSNDWTIIGYKK